MLFRSTSPAFFAALLLLSGFSIRAQTLERRALIEGVSEIGAPGVPGPLCVFGRDAFPVVAGKAGERTIPATAFFKALFETALQPGELITAVSFPAKKAGDRDVFLELARRHGDYAIVGLAVHNDRFVFFGVGDRPAPFSFRGKLDEAKKALREKLAPAPDLYNSAATKLHLAGVLLERAWNA